MILKDKVVIVTGAGPGMGKAACRGAAREGAKVVVTARSRAAIEEVAHEIVAAGGEAIAVPLDVTQMDQCHAAAKAALDTWGRIDGLVNSAYFHPDWGPLIEHDIDQVLQAFNVAAAGALRMSMAAYPAMKAQRSGSIVNISTLCTRKPMPGEGGYGMAKGALNHMTRHLAVEFAGSGIRVNTALMGWMMGAPLQGFADSMGPEAGAAFLKQRGSEIPVGHIPTDADCAKAVYFLLSDHASEITGAMLDVNGGDWVAA
ncbi:SDR family oxidoreductase [Novosphingobium sp. Fuku2-ISO-50]|uniref:SDR family oxidoreductase n=1 Tax=Novosphingobium sp. Fuku2-ISO-50 TaxID=1739114 RepID=UPI00076C1DE2|nr:SDR family oxidoreductase [Novosphingobium sp. Fuku2-ISO-50]KUR81059.1 oxidoreductase [Novosphingobium sp. Fuku2-ISO-50]